MAGRRGDGEAVFQRPLGLAHAPLLIPAVGMILGILIDAYRPSGVGVYAAVFALAGVGLAALRRWEPAAAAAVLLAAVAVGACMHHVHYRAADARQIVTFTERIPIYARVTGRAVEPPVITRTDMGEFDACYPDTTRSRFLLDAERIELRGGRVAACEGLVQVHVHEPLLGVSAGDRVSVFGRLYRPAPPDNPGEFNWSRFQRRRGVRAAVTCEHAAGVRRVRAEAGAGGVPWLARYRQWMRRLLLDGLAPDDSEGTSLLDTIVLGQRSSIDRTLNQAFVRTGTVHFLCVSGMHVGMLALFGWGLGRVFGLRRPAAAGLVAGLVIAYVLLAEPKAPILRAGILAVFGCITMAMRQRLHTPNWIAASAMVILAFKPTELFSAGFQLSFLVLLAVIYLSPRVYALLFVRRQRLRPEPLEPPSLRRWFAGRVGRKLGMMLCVAIAAWLTGAPLAAYHFGRVIPWGAINSVLMFPTVFVLMVSGFTKLLLGAISPFLGSLLGPVVGGAAWLLRRQVGLLASLPWTEVRVSPPPLLVVVAGLTLLGLWAFHHRIGLRRRWLVLAGAGVAAAWPWLTLRPQRGGALDVWVLSVGAGQAIFAELPNGQTLVFDVGSSSPFDLGGATLRPFLARRHIRQIDAAIISHPNLDHYSGVPGLLRAADVRQVLLSEQYEPVARARRSEPALRVLAICRRARVPVRTLRAGDRLGGTGAVAVEVLWPPPAPTGPPTLSANDSSIVVRLSYAGRRIVIPADAQQAAQAGLLAAPDQLRADVLVLPHHGRSVGNTGEFIRAVAPRVAVCSSGSRHTWVPPAVAELLGTCPLLNTADDGCLHVRVEADGTLRVEPIGTKPRG